MTDGRLTGIFSSSIHSFNLVSSVVARYRGALNGVGMAATAIFRTVGPSFGGSIFAWSLAHDLPFPFNRCLAFLCFIVIFVWSYRVSLRLPASLNEPIKEA